MKIVHPYYFEPITISSENPETLVVEKGDYLRSIVTELTRQYKNGEGQFVISENNQIKDFSKSINLITDIFQLDLEGKTFKTRIQSYLAEVCFDSEEGAQLVSKIKQYAYRLCENTVYPITFESEFQLMDLIKFLNFRFHPDCDNMVESLTEVIAGTMNILNKKLCITLNLKDFFARPAKGAIHRGCEPLPVRPSEPPCSRLGLCSSAQLDATRMRGDMEAH